MKRALSLPKIAGIAINIHWTFTILIAWIVFTNLRAGLDAVHIGWMVLFVLSLFVCVTLHELGHALAARRYGIKTVDITLYPIGGVASLERMPEKPRQELVVALAGPLVNVVIMLLLLPVIANFDWPDKETQTVFLIDQNSFLPMLGVVNIWLAMFNLIPAFPMDGGRVLRALLSMQMNRVKATETAATIGQIIAVGFVFAGFYLNPFLIFIGLFIILGARAEAEMVKTQSFLHGLTARDAVMTNYSALDKNQTIGEAVRMLLDGEAKNFLVTDQGEPFGVLNRDHIIRGIQAAGESAPIHSVADTNLQFAEMQAPLQEVMQNFQQAKLSILLVREHGRLIGIIDLDNISELILVNAARGQRT
ncbi:MAG: site-2 protease family protein [Lewinellaceae bacterium]|nr:site-2 protease family protein [Lewinellaceae bacterium]